MNWRIVIVEACTFVPVSILTYLALRAIWSFDKRLHDRLQDLPQGSLKLPPLAYRSKAKVEKPTFRSRILKIASRLMPNDQKERSQLEARLLHAGIYASWAPSVFLCVKMFLIVTPPIVGFVLGQLGVFDPKKSLCYGAIAGGIGIVVPSLWLDRRKARRHAVLSRSLPDFLDLMITCVQSGLSLEAGLQRVTDELDVAHSVLAGEMAVVQRQIEMGTTPDLAIRNFADRTDLAPLYSLSTLIEQARRFGTSLVDALRTQAEMLRYHREQRAEEMAHKAAVKILFPTLLFIFPAIFVVLVGPAAVQLSENLCSQAPVAAPHR